MNNLKIGVGLLLINIVGHVMAKDVFPIYSTSTIRVVIATNTAGCLYDPSSISGTNFAYTMQGQIFTNSKDGHIQTTSEGFSGETDKNTPWKTLTELLAAYQQGCPESKLRSLYSATSIGFMDQIYTNKDTASVYKNYGLSITKMNACIGYSFQDGYLAYVKIDQTNNSQIDPIFLIKTNDKYYLSTYFSNETNVNNIMVFLNSGSVTNLIR